MILGPFEKITFFGLDSLSIIDVNVDLDLDVTKGYWHFVGYGVT
jgi:hypothetical protein